MTKTFQEIGEIERELVIVGRLIVLSVVLAGFKLFLRFSMIPS